MYYRYRLNDVPKWYCACTEVVFQRRYVLTLISYVPKSSRTEIVCPFVPKLPSAESDLTVYGPCALPATQPTVSEHWRELGAVSQPGKVTCWPHPFWSTHSTEWRMLHCLYAGCPVQVSCKKEKAMRKCFCCRRDCRPPAKCWAHALWLSRGSWRTRRAVSCVRYVVRAVKRTLMWLRCLQLWRQRMGTSRCDGIRHRLLDMFCL